MFDKVMDFFIYYGQVFFKCVEDGQFLTAFLLGLFSLIGIIGSVFIFIVIIGSMVGFIAAVYETYFRAR